MKKQLEGKTALVSGAAGGAGEATSRLFAQEGARVAIVDIQEAAGRELARQIRSEGEEALFAKADVSQAAAVQRAVDTILEHWNRIDVLVNHAGTTVIAPFLETTQEQWDWLMDVNVKSMFLMCRAVLPSMLEAGGGVIVNTGSISGYTASPLETVYCITKGAVHQLRRGIAVEYRERGIRCNCIAPGFILTPHGLREMKECAERGVDFGEEGVRRLQGRLCEPEEIAQVILFLASDQSSFVNGAVLAVDNTWTAAS